MRKYIKIFEIAKFNSEMIYSDILEMTDLLINEKSFSVYDLDYREGDYKDSAEGDMQLITPFGEVPFYHDREEYHHEGGGNGCAVSLYYRDANDLYEIEIRGYSKRCNEDDGDLDLDDLKDFYKIKPKISKGPR